MRAAGIAAGAARNGPVAVVVSAMAGMTDALLDLAQATAGSTSRAASTSTTRERSLAELRRSLADRHLRAAREAVPEKLLPEVEEGVRTILGQLTKTTEAPADDCAARKDAIASFGERLSAEILAGAMNGLGASVAVAPGDPIATNGDFGQAEVLAAETRRRARRYVRPLLDAGSVVVVPGYVGRALSGAVTTLGRGGSDLSATALGQALGSREVWIMSDVDGVLGADPSLVPNPVPVRHLSYREAAHFASLGAKVLHPKAVAPAAAASIEVRVRSTFNPDSSGTLICDREGEPGVRGVALRRGLRREYAAPEAAEDVFCVLRADAEGLMVLSGGAPADIAAVVCIGAPTEEDLSKGLRCLHRAGIRPLFAGNTSVGLLFAVARGSAEAALQALHAGLVSAVSVDAREVA